VQHNTTIGNKLVITIVLRIGGNNVIIGVLYGGLSSEREISIKTGKNIVKSLRSKGYTVKEMCINQKSDYTDLLIESYDIIFNGLHGGEGENGTIQALLDVYDIPYIGSGMASSNIAMDKWKAKQILKNIGIPIAKDRLILKTETINIQEIIDSFSFPIVVKPNSEGSSIGLAIAKDKSDLQKRIENIRDLDSNILVEEFISGTEVTVGVIGEIGNERALPVIEINTKNEFFDYNSKYMKGMSQHLVPANLPTCIIERLQEYAIKIHKILGCKTYSRIDFIVNKNGVPVFLEVNTLPGMTETSLFPKSLKSKGVSYEEMLEMLLIYEIKNYIKINKCKLNSPEIVKRLTLFRNFLASHSFIC
jgi:D-alanine-D-alanine ligase